MNTLTKIKKVFDGGENSSFVHWTTQQAGRFIDYIKDESVLLKKVRVEKMDMLKRFIG